VDSSKFSSEPASSDDSRDGSRYLNHVFLVCFFMAFAYSFFKRIDEAIVGVISVGVGVGEELELELEDSDDEETLLGLDKDVGYLFNFALRFFLALVSSSESYSSGGWLESKARDLVLSS
jgi:hypothetical protein